MLTTLLSLHQSLLSPQYHPSPPPTLAAPSSHHAFISLNEFVPFFLFCSTPSQCFPSLLPKGPVYIFCLLSINESIYGIDFLPLLVTWGWMLMFVFEKSYSPSYYFYWSMNWQLKDGAELLCEMPALSSISNYLETVLNLWSCIWVIIASLFAA